ncbi:GAF domain-containing protein [Methanolapillus ohkumae]|uniref:histidine kinase n=1 Tax=Methanolapillus ohkumae TaxID=3028298 RepID=A0AA96V6I3_9EURY|nr:Adaptive-response sensory-kinase SasA [Methanosarcinaceae archaeon Am2]
MTDSDMENELEFILNSSPVIVFRFRAAPGLPVEYISKNVIQLGYPAEEFSDYHYNYENIIYLDDLDNVRQSFKKYSSASGLFGFTITYRIYTKFGSVRWVEQRTIIGRDDAGNITHYQGLVFDVTEQKKAEEELALNVARQEVLLTLKKMSASPLQEIVDFVREEAVRLSKSKIGYLAFPTPDELTLIMHSWSQTSVKECSIDENNRPYVYPLHSTGIWGEAVRQRKPLILNDYTMSNPLKKGYPKGHVTLYRYMHVPIMDGGRVVIVAGVGNKETDYNDSDVLHLTLLMEGLWELIQKKRLEEALQRRSKELSDHYAKLRTMSVMSKEFLDDVQKSVEIADKHNIYKYKNILADEFILMSYEQQQSVIEQGLVLANRVKHLVDSLLYMSMERSGMLYYRFGRVDLRSLFEQVGLNTILFIEDKGICLRKKIPEKMPAILGDPERLLVVFTTLIENACINTPQGGEIFLGISFLKDGKTGEEAVEIQISDSGKPLEESEIPYLFQSITFIDSNRSYSNHMEGVESGLYVAKNIILAHKGQIWGETHESGATFIVRLPVLRDSADETNVSKNSEKEEISGQKKHEEHDEKRDTSREKQSKTQRQQDEKQSKTQHKEQDQKRTQEFNISKSGGI